MSDFIVALGLVLVLEGLLYGGLPGVVKRMAADIVHIPDGVMRVVGLTAMVIGVVLVWLVRG